MIAIIVCLPKRQFTHIIQIQLINYLYWYHLEISYERSHTMAKKVLTTLSIIMFSVAATAFAGSYSKSADIVDTAVSAGDFNTLVTAVKAAELVDTLKGDGPFTVFAPTDEAFAKLPPGTVETLLKPENKEKLQAILLYHVVPGKVMAAEVVGMSSAKTAGGQSVTISQKDGGVYVDTAKVIKTDIGCSNGVIHVIDTVIMPK
jgi:uncharacterized surface protein with fasciclin (FAS1) repeats